MVLHAVTPRIGQLAGPAIPVLGLSVDHRRLRVRIQDGQLLLQLVRKPDIVGIQKGDVRAGCFSNPQVPRGAHPPVLAPRVVQVANPAGIHVDERAGDLRTSVVRAVVNEQQFPVRIRLSQHALDGYLEKRLGVQEDDDHRDERLARHAAFAPDQFPSHQLSHLPKVAPSTSDTKNRGSANGSLRARLTSGTLPHALAKPHSRTMRRVSPLEDPCG